MNSCDEEYKDYNKDMLQAKKHENSVAKLYKLLQKKIDCSDDGLGLAYLNKKIDQCIRSYRPPKCFVYGPRGKGRFIYKSGSNGKIVDPLKEADRCLYSHGEYDD